ncbi:unnamed protein product [Tenebrio molitor]|nr:unnamed protein product [Tenebrio molitor]
MENLFKSDNFFRFHFLTAISANKIFNFLGNFLSFSYDAYNPVCQHPNLLRH